MQRIEIRQARASLSSVIRNQVLNMLVTSTDEYSGGMTFMLLPFSFPIILLYLLRLLSNFSDSQMSGNVSPKQYARPCESKATRDPQGHVRVIQVQSLQISPFLLLLLHAGVKYHYVGTTKPSRRQNPQRHLTVSRGRPNAPKNSINRMSQSRYIEGIQSGWPRA